MLDFDGGKEFFEEEAAVGVGDAVVFVAAVESREGVFIRGWDDAGLDEETDDRWDLFLRDEVVKDDGGVVDDAILEDHEGTGSNDTLVVDF